MTTLACRRIRAEAAVVPLRGGYAPATSTTGRAVPATPGPRTP